MVFIREGNDWRILADGLEQPLSELKVMYVPPKEFVWDGELVKIIAQLDTAKFQAVSEVAAATKRAPTAGVQFGLNDYIVDGKTLEISLRPANYFDAIRDHKVATIHELQEKRTAIGKEILGDPYALYARVLAVNSAVKLSDGNYVIQLRDPKQAEYQLTFGTPGGHPKPENIDNNGKVYDWNNVMRTQIQRELGVSKEDIASLKLIGLGENTHTHKPDLLYRTELSLDAEELMGLKGAEDREFLGKYFVPEEDLPDFIKDNQQKGQLSFPKGTSSEANYLVKKIIDDYGLDPTTSNNFCPVHEATLALSAQMDGYDLSGIHKIQ